MSPASRRAVLLGAVLALPMAVLHGLSSLDRDWSRSELRAPEEMVLDLDYRLRAAVRHPAPPDPLRLVLEDDRTRDRTGGAFVSEWAFLSTLVEKIAADHPKVIFLDYGFGTPDLVERLGDRLHEIRTAARADGNALGPFDPEIAEVESSLRLKTAFLDALGKAPIVLPMFCGARDVPLIGGSEQPLPDELVAEKSWALPTGAPRAERCARLRVPETAFVQAAAALGYDDFAVDGDGTVRREQLLIRTTLEGKPALVPGIAVLLAARALGVPRDAVAMTAAGLRIGDRLVPLAPDGSAMIGFTGGAGSFLQRSRQGHPLSVSAESVFDGSLPPGTFTDRVVLLGEARSGSTDVHATPFDHRRAMPGVEAIAIETATLLEPRYPLYRPAAANRAGFLLTLLLWAAGVWAGVSLPLRRSITLGFAVPLLLLAAGALAFVGAGAWIDTAYPAGGWLIALFGAAITRNRMEDGERRFLHEAFTKYLSPRQVDVLLENRSALRLYGDERELTILFADLRGFTARTERLRASEMVALLNEHLTAMSKVVAKHDGIVDKYIGDCVMAFWGAPIEDPRHAVHACAAGLEMQETLARENARRAAEGRDQLAIGVGICSGKVVVGNMGSELKFDYTVIGDAVNLASRLEGLTKEAGYGVLIGERTRELLGDAIAADELGPMKVKGKSQAVRVFGLRASRYGVAEGAATAVDDGTDTSESRRTRPA